MGLELKFLKNRIGLDFTYYSQISKNQIMGMASSHNRLQLSLD